MLGNCPDRNNSGLDLSTPMVQIGKIVIINQILVFIFQIMEYYLCGQTNTKQFTDVLDVLVALPAFLAMGKERCIQIYLSFSLLFAHSIYPKILKREKNRDLSCLSKFIPRSFRDTTK